MRPQDPLYRRKYIPDACTQTEKVLGPSFDLRNEERVLRNAQIEESAAILQSSTATISSCLRVAPVRDINRWRGWESINPQSFRITFSKQMAWDPRRSRNWQEFPSNLERRNSPRSVKARAGVSLWWVLVVQWGAWIMVSWRSVKIEMNRKRDRGQAMT